MKISHWKAPAALSVLVLVTLAGLAGLSPSFRFSNFGLTWTYKAAKGSEQRVLLSLAVGEGREVRGKDVQGPVALSEAGKFEAYLDEACQAASGEIIQEYRVAQVRSEQFDWNQPNSGKLTSLRWTARIAPRGPLNNFEINDKSSSLWSRRTIGALWMSALWPGLPPGRIRTNQTWSSQIQTTCSLPELPDGFPLRFRSDYRWDVVRVQGGHQQLEYSWTGSVDGDDVTGASTGKGVYDVQDQRIVLAEFRTEFQASHPLSVPGSQEAPVAIAVHEVVSGRVVRETFKK